MAADKSEIIGEFVAAQDGDIGQENVGTQVIDETGNLKSGLAGLVRNDVEAVVIPLRTGLILGGGAELVVPGNLKIIVVRMSGATGGKSGEGLHIRRLFEIVSISVSQRNLIVRVDVVVEANGREVIAGVVGKDSALSFKLVLKKRIERGLSWTDERISHGIRVQGQHALKSEGANRGG